MPIGKQGAMFRRRGGIDRTGGQTENPLSFAKRTHDSTLRHVDTRRERLVRAPVGSEGRGDIARRFASRLVSRSCDRRATALRLGKPVS
jgi:hypothetical protein